MIKDFLRAINLLVFFYVLVCLILSIPVPSYAGNLFEDKYGSELKSAPYSVRVRYANDIGSPWAEATYDERFQYLLSLQQEEDAAMLAKQTEENEKILADAQKEQAQMMEEVQEQNKKFAKENAKLQRQFEENRKKEIFQQKLLLQKQRIEKLRTSSENRR